MKANGGMFMIDDFGRQQVRPSDLLNRWIVPLEKRIDFLTLHTGQKFEVPFDQLLIFSTNLDPVNLADEAFLRRIRYKIEVDDPTEAQFGRSGSWSARPKGVEFDDEARRLPAARVLPAPSPPAPRLPPARPGGARDRPRPLQRGAAAAHAAGARPHLPDLLHRRVACRIAAPRPALRPRRGGFFISAHSYSAPCLMRLSFSDMHTMPAHKFAHHAAAMSEILDDRYEVLRPLGLGGSAGSTSSRTAGRRAARSP